MEVVNSILENYPKSKKILLEDIGVETDEDAGVSLPQSKTWSPSTGPEIITCYGLRETGWKKLRSSAFCGWTNRKLITQFHATHKK